MAAKQTEPLNPLDLFAQMTRRIYQDKVWSGKVPNGAWRVLCWMIDRTTRNVEMDGVVYGEVEYAHRISYLEIANDLSCSWKAIQRATGWLCGNGYLSRGNKGFSGGYRWSVLNSARKFKVDNTIVRIPDLYPAGLICPDCSKAIADCGCSLTCDEPGCSAKFTGSVVYVSHLYTAHGLKLAQNGSLVPIQVINGCAGGVY